MSSASLCGRLRALRAAVFGFLAATFAGRALPHAGDAAPRQEPFGIESAAAPVHLPLPLARWLYDMANKHNCGAINKTMRDLLAFYVSVPPSELDQIFHTQQLVADVKPNHPALGAPNRDIEESSEPIPNAAIHPSLTREHGRWIETLCTAYQLEKTACISRLLQFAMLELDDELLFQPTVYTPSRTWDLYSDFTNRQG